MDDLNNITGSDTSPAGRTVTSSLGPRRSLPNFRRRQAIQVRTSALSCSSLITQRFERIKLFSVAYLALSLHIDQHALRTSPVQHLWNTFNRNVAECQTRSVLRMLKCMVSEEEYLPLPHQGSWATSRATLWSNFLGLFDIVTKPVAPSPRLAALGFCCQALEANFGISYTDTVNRLIRLRNLPMVDPLSVDPLHEFRINNDVAGIICQRCPLEDEARFVAELLKCRDHVAEDQETMQGLFVIAAARASLPLPLRSSYTGLIQLFHKATSLSDALASLVSAIICIEAEFVQSPLSPPKGPDTRLDGPDAQSFATLLLATSTCTECWTDKRSTVEAWLGPTATRLPRISLLKEEQAWLKYWKSRFPEEFRVEADFFETDPSWWHCLSALRRRITLC